MDLEIAIHNRTGSYSERWINCCNEQQIPFRLVDCYRPGIIKDLQGARALLWHWSHTEIADLLTAKAIIASAEMMGLMTYPNIAACWHFDDKVSQKYLLEAIGAPIATTYIFYRLDQALAWIEQADFPKVFKLKRGSGSVNVRLVKNTNEARQLAKQAFTKGFKTGGGYFSDTPKKLNEVVRRRDFTGVLTRLPQAFWNAHKRLSPLPRENSYVYFQDFYAGNSFDTRITVIGGRAFGYVRKNRKGDFRASGSGARDFSIDLVDPRCINISFAVAEKLDAPSLALDFVKDEQGNPRLVEISYCFGPDGVIGCSGYWDVELNWHEERLFPQDAILADILTRCRELNPTPFQQKIRGEL